MAKNTVDPGSIAYGSWNGNPHSFNPNNPGVAFASTSPGHRVFAAGTFSLMLDLGSLPQPAGSVAAQVGETWRFQAWYRDQTLGLPTSNFTDGVALTFR